jgi:hypothetical protein
VSRAKRRKQAVVTGRLVEFDDSYPREVAVPRQLVVSLLWAGALFRLPLAALGRGGGGAGRRWKDVRKGPEYLVTPIRLLDGRGRLVELEIHGYLTPNALHVGDQLRTRIRWQGDEELPPLAYHIANLTTGRVLEPRVPTLLSHLGLDVVLHAALGLALVIAVGLCVWGLLG